MTCIHHIDGLAKIYICSLNGDRVTLQFATTRCLCAIIIDQYLKYEENVSVPFFLYLFL